MSPLIFQIYGLLRMILGVAQIVGLTSGFFITEWVLKYPSGSVSFIFDQDILALVYLAVILRAVFHLVAGIGIARLSEWVIGWLMLGWIIVLIIVGGLMHTQISHWIEIGLAKNYGEILSWPKLFIYLIWVILDYVVVIPYVREMNESTRQTSQELMDFKKVGIIFFASVAFFVILLFLGKPIKQGFHQGYYRISGAEPELKVPAKAVEPEKLQLPQRMPRVEKSAVTKELLNKDDNEEEKVPEPKVDLPANPNVPEDIPYRQTIGYVAGLAIVAGLFLQFLCVYNRREIQELIYSYVLQGAGFFLLLFYAMSNKIVPVTFLSFFALSLTMTTTVVLWFQRKNINRED